jgi:hypothetical protein
MTIFNDCKTAKRCLTSSPRVRGRMLQQMAEALEDEAAGLYRRAAAYEEEEFLLNCEISERQTEINRLLLKLEAMRSQRDGLLDKIEAIRNEAADLREEVGNSEEEMALAVLDNARERETFEAGEFQKSMSFSGEDKASESSLYFRRMNPADAH